MRFSRAVILVLFFSSSFFLACRLIITLRHSSTQSLSPSLQNFFTFGGPASLFFPQNAAISLGDDNTTFFPARPAAFGPDFPVEGLGGRLWVGIGFGEDNSPDGDGVGEFGCSDVPRWEDRRSNVKVGLAEDKLAGAAFEAKGSRRRKTTSKSQPREAPVDDGTDDYLHQGLPQSKHSSGAGSSTMGSNHADIQTIQETAEITGKIALLKRGGCGFAQKVKWAQRRGAIAVVIGDSQKGAPLVQMFAQGDAADITIPSIFTSWTTAHLLSSLMQPGSFIEDIVDKHGNPTLKVHQSSKAKKNKKVEQAAPVTFMPTPTSKPGSAKFAPPAGKPGASRRSWLSGLLRRGASDNVPPHQDRSPRSGRLDWELVDDWSDKKDKLIKTGLDKASKKPSKGSDVADSDKPHDNFQIGIQDWRDPDLVGAPADSNSEAVTGSKPSVSQIPSGGSSTDSASRDGAEASADTASSIVLPKETTDGKAPEGLWITITPTTSVSPLFDTLLVLVISPLVTLTVVYALLVMRAKIRRRSWRAPKSVVERLPVRTYYAIATSSTQSTRVPSPASSSPNTPLLLPEPAPRPPSHTNTDIPRPADLVRVDSALQASATPTTPSAEIIAPNASGEWRRYMGRQVECVVCLEEYEDGVSQVMSLPCGHEFHVDCITPWLTRQRRTCPICKGDVVRSLARGSTSPQRPRPATAPRTQRFRPAELFVGLRQRTARESRTWSVVLMGGRVVFYPDAETVHVRVTGSGRFSRLLAVTAMHSVHLLVVLGRIVTGTEKDVN
ncbi:hypothetical protein B0H63DRAFT_496669 [Podospora didyma]|uniref:RING-type E3 ubiquitin transferase n=1 Tax=Podospora didyma TaxID=330526 RepID=A0AAE0N6F8_9PEZI|nr:hypothetical protein B0H63DRAFT_496669 [Podospora didyma]